jgi:hypothetical protein
MTGPEKITFGELREMGLCGVLIYCADYHCSHSVAISAERWDDRVRGCPTSSRCSPAPPAASGALISGRISVGRGKRSGTLAIPMMCRSVRPLSASSSNVPYSFHTVTFQARPMKRDRLWFILLVIWGGLLCAAFATIFFQLGH